MFVQIESAFCKRKTPKKKGKFAISINPQGRSKYYIKKLKYFLKETYPFLKEECPVFREKSLKAAKPGDIIVFGTGKKYDYTTVSVDTYVDDPKISDELELIPLEEMFKLVKSSVKRYVHKNYPDKVSYKTKKRYYCPPQEETYLLGTRPVARRSAVIAASPAIRRVVATSPCRPVHVVKAPRPSRDWDLQVNNTYVLLTKNGRYETRNITRCGGRETVSIDGTRYTIRRDHAGRGIVI